LPSFAVLAPFPRRIDRGNCHPFTARYWAPLVRARIVENPAPKFILINRALVGFDFKLFAFVCFGCFHNRLTIFVIYGLMLSMTGNSVWELAIDFVVWLFMAYLWIGITIGFYESQRSSRFETPTPEQRKENRMAAGFVGLCSALLVALAHLAFQISALYHH
jgi:hypothetical protein